ncbi:MAG: AEC family transporter [Thiobacillaceae bacterium]|jgi:predicted permease
MHFSYYFDLLAQVLFPMALLIAAGAIWRTRLDEASIRAVRGYITAVVINLFAPALLFAAAASAEVNTNLLSVPLLVASGMLVTSLPLYWLLFKSRVGTALNSGTGAGLLLCGTFGNVLFMGYPLLTHLYSDAGGRYAAFADMAATTPLLWSVGVWIAVRLGRQTSDAGHPLKQLLSLPPVWAFFVGVCVGLMPVNTQPLIHAAHFIGQPTVPVMLLMLGLSIPWRRLTPSAPVLITVAFKLVLMPLAAFALAKTFFDPISNAQRAAVLEAGVPTMLMAVGLADRYHLDVEKVALTVAWSTLLFLLTLPMWLILINA